MERLLQKVSRQKQVEEIWEGTARLARAWIAPPSEPPYRPYMSIVVSETGAVVHSAFADSPQTASHVFYELVQAMRRPMPGAGRRRRPRAIYLDNPELVVACTPMLAKLNVGCEYRGLLPTLKDVLLDMEAHLRGGETVPCLVTLPYVTLPLLRHLYELAADFLRAAPWRWMDDRHPLEIRRLPNGKPRYAVVMGGAGEVFGLAAYDTLDHLRLVYRADTVRREATEAVPSLALFFDEATVMSFDDLDAIAEHGLPLAAADEPYPVFVRSIRGEPIAPSLADLLWMEDALAAVVIYVRKHKRLRRGNLLPAALNLTVEGISGRAEVSLRLPASQ